MGLTRIFRVSRSFLPLLAAGTLAACGSDPNSFGEPFTAADAGAPDAMANAGKSGSESLAGRAAAGSGGKGGSGGAKASDDDDHGAAGSAAGRGGAGGKGGSGGAGGAGGKGGAGGNGPAAGSGGAGGSSAAAVSFGDIFSGTIQAGCSCHSGGAGGLDLSSRANAYKNLVSVASSSCDGEKRVVPGNPDASVFFHALNHSALGQCKIPSMPQGRGKLTQAQLDQVKSWIAAGAPDN